MKTPAKLVIALFSLASLTFAARLAQATWEPWKFSKNETYEIRLTNLESDDEPLTIVLDISPGASPDTVVVSHTTRVTMPASDLGPNTAFGGLAMGMAPSLVILNPLVATFMNQVELEVGTKTALMGMGKIEVTGKETIAGREGFVCKMFGPKQQDSPLQFEWVVDPELALPLRSVTYDQGKKTMEAELVRYEKR